jgi:hypothetical protein
MLTLIEETPSQAESVILDGSLKFAGRFRASQQSLGWVTNRPEGDPYLYDSPHYSGFASIHSLWDAESPSSI